MRTEITSPSLIQADDLPATDFSLVWVRSAEELRAHVTPWRRLVETAADRNVFFEPELLLPALEELDSKRVRLALVYAPPRQNAAGPPALCGLFPLRDARWRSETWLHDYAFQGAPLVRADVAQETWEFFLREVLLAKKRSALLLRFRSVDGASRAHRCLLESARRLGLASWVQDSHYRASFVPRASADEFALRSIRRKVRRNLKRERRILEARGSLTAAVERLPRERVDAWCDDFLRLEASGWKGRRGTAIASKDSDVRWFRTVAAGLAADHRLLVGSLLLDGRPVAMGTMFAASGGTAARDGEASTPGAAFFKIAHDESIPDVSLGALLQLEWLDFLHGPGAPESVDSCAVAGHTMIERVWSDRRPVATVWLGRGSLFSSLALWLFQGAYAWKAAQRRRRSAPAR